MARALHRQLGTLNGAVPVMDIAYGLDIDEVRQDALDGCEGLLLTDMIRSQGRILVNMSRGPRPARYSIAHEIGHWLMERHELGQPGGFACSRADMRQRKSGTTQHQRQEREANQFAIGLLAPPQMMGTVLNAEPELQTILDLADHLDLSMEATIRRVIELHDKPLAAIWSHAGVVQTTARHEGFPWLDISKGQRLPNQTAAASLIATGEEAITQMADSPTGAWTERADVAVFEQTRLGRNGRAVTLLNAKLLDEGDDDDIEELGIPTFSKKLRKR